jgi:probable HAF family extracellular repeat protein
MALSLFHVAAQVKAKFDYTTLDVPGATLTQALGVNASGDIVGAFTDTKGAQHGFLLENGTYTQLDVPGKTGSTVAFGINASGDIVGAFTDTT